MKLDFVSYLAEAKVNDENIDRLVAVFKRRMPRVLGTQLYRYGGANGVEHLPSGEIGYLFIFGDRAFRLRAKSGHLNNIDIWDHFALNVGPAFSIRVSDLEAETLLGAFNEIANVIKNPSERKIAVNKLDETIQLDEMARQIRDPNEFYKMVVRAFGATTASAVTWEQIKQVATENDVLIPAYIRNQKIGRGRWDAKPGSTEDAVVKGETTNAVAPVSNNVTDVEDADGGSKVVAAGGKILYIKVTAQDPTTKRFLPAGNVPEAQALYRQIQNSMTKGATPEELKDPETLYGHMAQLVEMACKGTLRSLLIYGGPGTGKTFTIMQTVNKMGLVKGEDYQKLSGKASPIKIYETLFMYRDGGLVIFDDLDSMWGNEDATNILKAALDTSPVREISWVSNQTINVSKMSDERKSALFAQIDREINGEPPEDFNETEDEDDEDLTPRERKAKERAKEKAKARAAATTPDKIKFPSSFDFTGRVVFISNLKKEDFDTAILSRSAKINMDLTPEQILMRMRSILPELGGKDVSVEKKGELLDELIKQHGEGKFDAVTMREFIKGMDILRSGAPNWKELLVYA